MLGRFHRHNPDDCQLDFSAVQADDSSKRDTSDKTVLVVASLQGFERYCVLPKTNELQSEHRQHDDSERISAVGRFLDVPERSLRQLNNTLHGCQHSQRRKVHLLVLGSNDKQTEKLDSQHDDNDDSYL